VNPGARSAALTLGAVALAALYPALVYLLMHRGQIRYAGVVLLAVVLARWLAPGPKQGHVLIALALGAVLAVAIGLTSSETLARLYPVAVSALLLAAFGYTLVRPPPMIERLVRATGAELDAVAVRYLHRLTLVWCGFFAINGCIALATTVAGSREAWALYNGLISYVIAGSIFLGERLVRQWVLRRSAGIPG
jgi:uncharacterized membrane protein